MIESIAHERYLLSFAILAFAGASLLSEHAAKNGEFVTGNEGTCAGAQRLAILIDRN